VTAGEIRAQLQDVSDWTVVYLGTWRTKARDIRQDLEAWSDDKETCWSEIRVTNEETW
jgi:hypothetical protein